MRPPIAISRVEGGSQGFSEVCLDIFSVSQSIPARTSQESIIVMRKFSYAILEKKKKKKYIYLFKRGQTRSDHSTEWDSDLYAEDQLPTLTLVQNKSLSAETKTFFFQQEDGGKQNDWGCQVTKYVTLQWCWEERVSWFIEVFMY